MSKETTTKETSKSNIDISIIPTIIKQDKEKKEIKDGK